MHVHTYVFSWYTILSMRVPELVLAPFYIVGIVEMVGYVLTTKATLLTRDPIETENIKLCCRGNI